LILISPAADKVRINGIDVTKELMATKQPVAFIPEQVNFYRVLSGFENLDYFFSARKI